MDGVIFVLKVLLLFSLNTLHLFYNMFCLLCELVATTTFIVSSSICIVILLYLRRRRNTEDITQRQNATQYWSTGKVCARVDFELVMKNWPHDDIKASAMQLVLLQFCDLRGYTRDEILQSFSYTTHSAASTITDYRYIWSNIDRILAEQVQLGWLCCTDVYGMVDDTTTTTTRTTRTRFSPPPHPHRNKFQSLHDIEVKVETERCVVCLINKRQLAAVECGHVCLCFACAANLSFANASFKCPLCRKNVLYDNMVRVFV
jgi:hypothetical protein